MLNSKTYIVILLRLLNLLLYLSIGCKVGLAERVFHSCMHFLYLYIGNGIVSHVFSVNASRACNVKSVLVFLQSCHSWFRHLVN